VGKELQKAVYEWGEVEKEVDGRGEGKWREYLDLLTNCRIGK
jgi:signal recognition particle protein